MKTASYWETRQGEVVLASSVHNTAHSAGKNGGVPCTEERIR